MDKYDIAVIGLSVMGRSLALNMADHGYRVAVYNRSKELTDAMIKEYPHEGIRAFYSLEELAGALSRPRKIIMMIKAGAPVDAVCLLYTSIKNDLERFYNISASNINISIQR